MKPIYSPTNYVKYEQGVPTIGSSKKNSVIIQVLTPSFSVGENLSFIVMVKNFGTESFLFSPKNITAFVDGQEIRIPTYEELKEKIETSSGLLGLEALFLDVATMKSNQKNYTTIASWEKSELDKLKTILRENTVDPGKYVGGVIELKSSGFRAGSTLTLIIRTPIDEHIFSFDIKKSE